MIGILWSSSPTMIDALELDATERETHARTTEITSHPVEVGADVSDHIRAKPRTVTIDGTITNTPIAGVPGGGRAADAFRQLEELAETGRVVTIRTNLRTYDSMVLSSLTVPRDRTTGAALAFSATFQAIRSVQNRTTTVTVAAAKRKLGPQVGKQAADVAGAVGVKPPDARRSSMLKDGVDAVRGIGW